MIAVHNLTKRYGKNETLCDLSMAVRPNEVLALVGPSGCGKTTLLRLLAGLERPDDGRILIDNTLASTAARVVPPNQRKVSLIFQDLALWPHMTVDAHLRFAAGKGARAGKELTELTRGILSDVNLAGFGGRYPHELSGGEKQRLAIARGIASFPRYLLMDEPFNNLDPILKDELQDYIAGLLKTREMGVVYVTHNMAELSRLGDSIAVMEGGRVIQQDTADRVVERPRNGFVRRMLAI